MADRVLDLGAELARRNGEPDLEQALRDSLGMVSEPGQVEAERYADTPTEHRLRMLCAQQERQMELLRRDTMALAAATREALALCIEALTSHVDASTDGDDIEARALRAAETALAVVP